MADRDRLDPQLRAGYRACAKLTWRHGTTYYWGAALLPLRRRRHVYAVYALCRLADDIVDLPPPVRAERQPHPHLGGAIRATREQEVRDVRARDE